MGDDLTDKLTVKAIEAAPGVLSALWTAGRKWCSQRDLLQKCRKYRQYLHSECSRMQILGMEQPVPLKSIYTEVRGIRRVTARRYHSIAELEEKSRRKVENLSLKHIQEEAQKRLTEEILEERIRKAAESATKGFPEHLRRANKKNFSEADQLEWQQMSRAVRKARASAKADFVLPKDDELREYILQAETEAREQFPEHLWYAMRKDLNETDLLKWEEMNKQIRNARTIAQLPASLTDEEGARLLELIPAAVEEEIQSRVRKELNEDILRDFGHSEPSREPPTPAWDIVSNKERALVLGQPGAGKTTFLKHVALRHLEEQTPTPRLPIFVVLREFTASGFDNLLDFIADSFLLLGFPDALPFVERMLQGRHECVLLFDGLDEIPQSRQAETVAQIVRLSKKYRHNQYIVSCRTANYRGQLEGFSEFQIAEFGRKQVVNFVRGWFRESTKLAASFLADLKRNPGLAELTSTPLLLALLCIGYRRNQQFPDQRSLVYLTCIDAMLVDWDSSKQVRREKYVEHFDCESKKYLIAKVACDTFCENELFFTHDALIARFEALSEVLPIAGAKGEQVLKEYLENHGLLVERAKSIYSFSHLSIQEFFAALHVMRNPEVEVLRNLAKEAWVDDRWREVIIFLGGLLDRADPLLVCLRNQAKTSLADRNLQRLFVTGQMPQAVTEFVTTLKRADQSQQWLVWFRWRLFEYRIHRATYGAGSPSAISAAAAFSTSELLLSALNLRESTQPKPLASAIRHSVTELKPTGPLGIAESHYLTRYLVTTAMMVAIITSRARVTPYLKGRLLEDIAGPDTTLWNMPERTELNKLGV